MRRMVPQSVVCSDPVSNSTRARPHRTMSGSNKPFEDFSRSRHKEFFSYFKNIWGTVISWPHWKLLRSVQCMVEMSLKESFSRLFFVVMCIFTNTVGYFIAKSKGLDVSPINDFGHPAILALFLDNFATGFVPI